jgi:uncharacterized protein (DUF4415 family)
MFQEDRRFQRRLTLPGECMRSQFMIAMKMVKLGGTPSARSRSICSWWFIPIPIQKMITGYASSGYVRPHPMKGSVMEPEPSTERPVVTEEQRAQLFALTKSPDVDDLPEAPAENWQSARRFYRPRKEAISIRIDADVLDWLRRRSERYQTATNCCVRRWKRSKRLLPELLSREAAQSTSTGASGSSNSVAIARPSKAAAISARV